MNEKFDYAFRYFEIHAKQRMSTFNFFIVMSAFLTTAFVTTCQKDFLYPSLSFFVSIAMMLVSTIFWKLDQRVRFLIRHAEQTLESLEMKSEQVALFSKERKITAMEKKSVWQGLINEQLSYSQCFAVMYAIFFVFGCIGFLYRLSTLFS